jgi:hypothetical protein
MGSGCQRTRDTRIPAPKKFAGRFQSPRKRKKVNAETFQAKKSQLSVLRLVVSRPRARLPRLSPHALCLVCIVERGRCMGLAHVGAHFFFLLSFSPSAAQSPLLEHLALLAVLLLSAHLPQSDLNCPICAHRPFRLCFGRERKESVQVKLERLDVVCNLAKSAVSSLSVCSPRIPIHPKDCMLLPATAPSPFRTVVSLLPPTSLLHSVSSLVFFFLA